VATFSAHFHLDKSQGELDFVDVHLDSDTPLFVDPFSISLRQDRWGMEAHGLLVAFFQSVVDRIREGRDVEARRLLSYLREPNETRLGLSHGRPQGAGIGSQQADDLFNALRQSQAVQTGFLTSLEECELMIEGIGRDKISDLATNILRGHLAAYTVDQCELHGVGTRQVAVGPHFDLRTHEWINEYLQLPVAMDRPVLLVPKSIARYEPAYDHRTYYRHFALDYLQAEHLNAGSGLVHTLRNGRRKVYKKDLEAIYPCTKEYLFEFSREHPNVLVEYREHLAELERRGVSTAVEPEDEVGIAAALRAALLSVPPGNEAATTYHRLMIGVLEFVFFPSLVCPRKEVEIHEGRKRIDIFMENAAPTGIFNRLHSVRGLPSAFIVFECKNYSREIANPELDQIAGRFSPNRGKVGFICCRSFDDRLRFVRRCQDTFREDRGLIVAVDDTIALSWLQLIETRRRRDLDAEIGRLIDEVWLA
jgi:hypothetical protein